MPARDPFTFRVLGAKVTDGDTYRLRQLVSDAYRVRTEATPEMRLGGRKGVAKGFDTPETRSVVGRKVSDAEKAAGRRAREFAQAWFDGHLTDPYAEVWVNSLGQDPNGTYGRWLGEVYAVDTRTAEMRFLGTDLEAAGLAVATALDASRYLRWYEVYAREEPA